MVETPIFLRHQIPFAAYCEPAPNDSAQRGYYYVTPPQTEEELAEHDDIGLMHTCVHEAWPGHHLQFVTANLNPAARRLPRLLNASATFYEGWALYSEQLMQEEGFLNRPESRVILLRDRLWRALRILIDIEIHTRNISLETAANRLVTELGFPRSQALAELTWYSQAPTVPFGYATGWALINALRDHLRHAPSSLPLKKSTTSCSPWARSRCRSSSGTRSANRCGVRQDSACLEVRHETAGGYRRAAARGA